VSAWFSWGQIGVFGVSSDIAGAIALALSFMTKTPSKIAEEAPVHGFAIGNPYLAKSLVRQRTEAWVGLCFLVTGFTAQAVVYFVAGGNTSIHGWHETVVGVMLAIAPLVLLGGVFRWCVPRLTERTWELTWRMGHDGQPLEGDDLAQAERDFGQGGDWNR